MVAQLPHLLRARARRHGGHPLLTYYDMARQERTELSAISVSNWVDKTSNLLVDSYDVEPGAVLDLALAQRWPGHWVTLVLALAGWQVGAQIRVGADSSDDPATVTVVGPDQAAGDHPGAGGVLACALHPLGLGFDEPLPPGVDDFALEVRGQPDAFLAPVLAEDEVAWRDPERVLTRSGVAGAVTAGPARRLLVRPGEPWPTLRDALVRALVTDGSSVVVVGDDPDRLARIAETERVDG